MTCTLGALLEAWTEAGAAAGAWRQPLDLTATFLGATATTVIYGDCTRGGAFISGSAATPAFIRLCRELGPLSNGGVLQHDEAGLGRVTWIRMTLPAIGEIGLFALSVEAVEPDLLRQALAVAASAVVAATKVDAVSANSDLKTQALNQLPTGIVIVDEGLTVVERNSASETLFARRDGLGVRQGKLVCGGRRDHEALLSAVRAAIENATSETLRIGRTGAAKPYVVRVIAPAKGSQSPRHCVLMIVDPDCEPVPSGEIWRAMFDLTECELVIAEGILSGQRIHDVACHRGVSIETVRTQTKRMLERLDVSSQVQAAVRLTQTAAFRATPALVSSS